MTLRTRRNRPLAGMARWSVVACGLAALAVVPGIATAADGGVRQRGDAVIVTVAGGTASVRTKDLAVDAVGAGGKRLALSGAAADELGPAGPVTGDGGRATWSYPARGLTVTASAVEGRLSVAFAATADGSLSWPVSGTDRAATSLQIPLGEGLSIPVGDRFWNAKRSGLPGSEIDFVGGLTMPFWGQTSGRTGVGYLVPTDIGSTLRFASVGDRLRAAATHEFSAGRGTASYQVLFRLTDGSPVAAARDYRRWMDTHGGVTTLRQKIRANPEVGKLIGAFHAYTWGAARQPAAIAQLKRLGITRMWLGYDADGDPMTKPAIAAAQRAGYLAGPYDSFDNAQDPATADTPIAKWPAGVYPDSCVRRRDGTPQTGFGGRGCYLSTQALAQDEPTRHYLADHVRQMTDNGAKTDFLDVDAAGQLFDDFSPAHPMTKAQDRQNRLDRMRWLSSKFVLGSESAGSWATPVVSFSHGSSTPVADGFWKLTGDKAMWGAYWPTKAPTFFLKPATLPADLAKAMFAPRYRVPLYETALHDSIVNLDRWELGYFKLPAQQTTRALLAMLYNTPLNLSLDGPTLKQHGREIARLQRFFAPLHRTAATKRMTDFRWLTADHAVQRTRFGGDALTVTANFGATTYRGLPAGCVAATVRGDRAPRRLCPGRDATIHPTDS